ncbi:MAG: hypothetical protein U5S82_02545 [Gammaproteobacteria bacterium]|nr:hypothetical protein [Gammaproteobacteria bacterium]
MLAMPGAAASDLHRMWDDRCAECHGHSGEFARAWLAVEDGELRGRPARDIKEFMGHHYAQGQDADGLYRMLLAQATSPPRFMNECSQCHGSAADFVRESLTREDGRLMGRCSALEVGEFLAGHHDLDAADRAFFSALLVRVSAEVGVP